jgi:hypothetical protein
MVPPLSLSLSVSLSLSISLSSGDIVRGVQCSLSLPFGSMSSPLIYGGYERSKNQSKERQWTINLTEGTNTLKTIRSVSIRSGALVDSVTLTLSTGEVVTAGGRGGGEENILHIPPGYKVVGFYGGRQILTSLSL